MSVKPHETHHTVRGYECGYGGSLRPFFLANFFQEAAGAHAEQLGLGMEAMFASGRTWMLSRIDIMINRLPKTADKVLIRTWPHGTERIFAQRCMELLDSAGNLLAGALYDYFIYDIEKARPSRPEKILPPDLRGDRPLPYTDLAPGLQEPGLFPTELPGNPQEWGSHQDLGWRQAFSLDVAPRHIDNNGHVNNAYFISWLCDAIPPEERSGRLLRRIKVDFVSEARRGENLSSCWRLDESGAFLSVMLRDSQVIARGLCQWELD